MKNFVIITQYFLPEIGGGSQRSFGFAEELSKFDLNITVITPFPSYLMDKKDVKTKWKLYEKSEENGLTIYRTFVFTSDRGGFFKRILYYKSFALSAFLVGWLKIKKIDYLLTISPPLFTGITGVLLKKFKKAKFVFDIGDLWPESAVQLGFLKNKIAIKLAEFLERWIYKNSDAVNVVTLQTHEKVKKNHPEIKNLHYIPNFVNTSLINKLEKDKQLSAKLNLNGKIVYGYAGNIGSAQGVDIMVKAAALTKDIENIIYLIIGEGVDRKKLESFIKDNDLKNVILLNPVSKDYILSYISLFDVMVIPLVKNDLFKITIPSKLYESMAAEIPVLLCVDGEARRIVEETNCGFYVEPENHNMLAEKVREFNDNKTLIESLGSKGREKVMDQFARHVVIKNFHDNFIQNHKA